ncbi:MAG TPA: tetrahydrofolate dehydrogenase/cyclohydrolase catalytic domain-containing protein, partial [Solirubrobacterales bacterium]|nr:tetrahydrofolate dehydrogenase/cyclohydrolase catalytic domain-containing protein [Solirubrobacterales bacterium]
MAARVIDGKAVAAAVRERVKVDVEAYKAETGRTPGLATVLVGDDPASEIYVANKRRTTEEVGMRSIHHGPEASIREEELLELVRELGEDDEVDGILVQLPLPAHIDSNVIVQV